MKTLLRAIFCLFVTLIITTGFVTADSNNPAPLGFKFGMSNGDAKKQIKSNGYNIIKNEKDSKKVRTIIFEGAVVEVTDEKGIDQKTRLEFFNNKLMSSAVMIKTNDNLQFIDIQNDILKSIVSKYGEPAATDNMFSYDTWEWDIDHLGLILSANRDKGKLKLEYTYHPVASTKVESELNLKRKGDVRHPADQMFKDGNYSQQGGPGARTF
jgi:hypothetical protein